MKKVNYILALVYLIVGVNAFAQQKELKSMDLYLLIGQSNMAGRATIDAQSENTSDAIMMLDKINNWVVAKDPLHFDKPYAGVGPGLRVL